ncbi:MAG: LysR family transcriptional regulator, partial [Pseudomonadota bacterium]
MVDDLLALIEVGSVSGAAARRHVTQPAFSRRLRAIEGQLGFAVADRARKPAGPSPALAGFEAELRQVSVGLGKLRRRMADAADSGRMLRIGAVHALSASALPGALAQLEDALPFAQIRVRTGNREDCFSGLMTGQIDIMLAHESSIVPLPTDAAITDVVFLREDTLTPVIGAAQADAIRTRLAAKEAIPVVAYPEGRFLGEVLRRGVFS